MSFSDLADQFLTGKGDDMCRKIVKMEYFTFVRLEKIKLIEWGQAKPSLAGLWKLKKLGGMLFWWKQEKSPQIIVRIHVAVCL